MRRLLVNTANRRRGRLFLAGSLAALVAGAWLAYAAVAAAGPAAPTLVASPASSPSNSTVESFTFSGSGAVSYQCSKDGAAFAGCSSGVTYSGVTQGSHSFQVRGVDSKGKVGDVASYNWLVDTTPPGLVSINAAASSPTNAFSLSWAVTFSEPVVNVVQGDFGLASSGLGGTPAITGFAGSGAGYIVTASAGNGTGSLRLNLTSKGIAPNLIRDAAGNVLAASIPFVGQAYAIDRTPPPPPTFSSTPPDPQSAADASATFAFGEGESPVVFSCTIDGGAYGACTSPKTYTVKSLGQGHHIFAVRAVDPAGNAGPATQFAWDVVQPVKNFGVAGSASGSLYPGAAARRIDLALTNPNNYSLAVQSIVVTIQSVTKAVGAPAGSCPASAFVVTQFAGGYPFTIPNGTSALTSRGFTVSQLPSVTLSETGQNQDACKGATVSLSFQGIATK